MELFLPRTDAGAIAEALVTVIAVAAALVVVRGSREGRLLVLGLGMAALGWMALRTLH